MLIANYGIDNALCRVVYNLAGNDCSITLSSRYLQDYLDSDTFYLNDQYLVFVGFYNIEEQLIRRVRNGKPTLVISSYKRSHDLGFTLNDPEKSKTQILAEHLGLKDKYVTVLGKLAYHINTVNDHTTDYYTNFYDAIGNEAFIIRFINERNVQLTNDEIKIAEMVRDRKLQIVQTIFDNDDYIYEDSILVIRANFSVRRFVTNVLKESDRFSDITTVVIWDVTDVLLNIQIEGGSLIKEVVENLGGSFWSGVGNIKLPIPNEPLNNEYIFKLVHDEFIKVAENFTTEQLQNTERKEQLLSDWLNQNLFKDK